MDGMFECYRSDWTFKTFQTTTGKQTGVIYGVISSWLRYKKQFQVNPIMVWDGKPIHRSALNVDYKSTRERQRPEFYSQIKEVKEILPYLGAYQFYHSEWEADDTLASLAEKFSKKEEVVIVTCDKDLWQVVKDNPFPISVFNPIKKEFNNPITVKAKYCIEPNQLPLLWAIIGQAGDDIPGVPRFPSKVATSLIQKYGTLEDIFLNLDKEELSPNKKKSLKDNTEQVINSYGLAKINCELDKLMMTEGKLDIEKLKEIFNANEFNSFLNKIEQFYD